MQSLKTSEWEGRIRPGVSLQRLHDSLWRVTLPDGEMLGYVEQFLAEGGRRFRAKRLIPRQNRFLVVGEFWSADDAVESLRNG